MADYMETLTKVEMLRVLRQHCLNEDMYYHFIWIFSYTGELNRLKENPEELTVQRRLMLNKKLRYYFNKLTQMDKNMISYNCPDECIV